MRKIFIQSSIAAMCMFIGTALIAQNVVTVTPGLGTLETAIAENGGDAIYQLTAGAWYGLTSIIEVSDSTMGEGNGLVIMGEETDGLPATIQVGIDGEGLAFPFLIRTFNDLTIKNVFLAAQDISGVAGPGVVDIAGKARIVVDNCVIDPAGTTRTFGGDVPANMSVFYLTNNLIMNNGNVSTPNDGGWLGGIAWDTLWVENNTFVSSGQDFISGDFHKVPNNQFIWVNHNTFLWHDVWIKKSYNDQNLYFTNNLMQDISIFAQLYTWGQFFPDYKQGNTMLSLLAIDTLELEGGVLETLPSERNMFWQYNLQWNTPELLSIPKLGQDSGFTPIYNIPMMWDEDVPLSYTGGDTIVSPADSSRENRILADKVNWPNMKYNNNWYDLGGDPMWNDQMIGQINDSVKMNLTSWWSAVIWGRPGFTHVAHNYNYEVDKWAETPVGEYPQVWPRFDGTYTNAAMLTGSIEGLPLGDLNWYPADKSRWMAEKTQIEEHILALNEDRYELGPGVGIQNQSTSSEFSIYPNPANDVLHIASDAELNSARVFDVAGKLVKLVDIGGAYSYALNISKLNKGVYILEIETVSGESSTSKILKN
ncbi:MAG: T9SS type A sorting domain-containing protein [Bacteroidetes bacterium]|nr:T9SS type A sorting domain-containing protein [Bacteroidota bacterium]